MTAAERQQRKRDRQKAGLVRVEVWVPADKADAVKAAIARICAKPLGKRMSYADIYDAMTAVSVAQRLDGRAIEEACTAIPGPIGVKDE